ncbi:hypothetical protein HK097_004701 [Rhizophlyctis rosea]|uniref:Uncharacterized protein n=1 Tax=Rhizophlyctis rosea TaxID=64517 RepID=A0AAD5S3C5_9FUNG|nr:hypothetical protein HK097_004701 [Rhizophlyctis rosea]
MESSFASLFRSSRFAGLHKNQIIRVPKAGKQKGDAGLKHPVPHYNNEVHYVEAKSLDSPLTKGPDYKNGMHRVDAVRRWKENFPPPSEIPEARHWALASFDPPIPSSSSSDTTTTSRTSAPKPYVENLSPSQWRTLLTAARKKRQEFRTQVLENQIAPQSYAQFLNVSISDSGSSSSTTTTSPTSPTFTTSTTAIVRARNIPTVSVHPPVYTVDPTLKDPKTPPTKVWGRILNPLGGNGLNTKQSHGWAVGIGGIVAYLPKSYAGTESRLLTRDKYEQFIVKDARHDGQGRPEVVVSLRDRDGSAGGSADFSADQWKGLLDGLRNNYGNSGDEVSGANRGSGGGMLDNLGSDWAREKKEKKKEDVDFENLSSLFEGFESSKGKK